MKEDVYVFSQYIRPENPVNIPIAGISYCDSSYKIERTEYNYYVIEYVVSGEGILEVDGQCFNIKANDTYFLYKGRAHKYYCKGNSWEKIWFVMDGWLADVMFTSYLSDRPNVLHGFNIYRSMQNIMELIQNEELSYEEKVDQITIVVHKILIAAKDFNNTHSDNLHLSIKNYIDDNLYKPFKLEILSGIFHYSPNHIINVFRDKYGITPYAYFEKQRLLVSRELLTSTSMSVKEISAKLKYDNPQYFSKCFKRFFQISPSQFRRSMLEGCKK